MTTPKTDAELADNIRNMLVKMAEVIEEAKKTGLRVSIDKDEVVHYLKGESGARPCDIILVNRGY